MSERLELLRPVLSQYHRRFSVFSLGSGIEPGLEQELVSEYDCVVVCAEKDPLRYVPVGRMVVLSREFTAEDLEQLARSEHFDVVLAMNILHWCGGGWLRTLRALRSLGRDLIVQTPFADDQSACGQEVVTEIPQVLAWMGRLLGCSAQFPKHRPRPVWNIRTRGEGLLTEKFFGAPEGEIRAVAVNETNKILLVHKGGELRDYVPGISLQSWRVLGGSHPRPEQLIAQVSSWPALDHRDIQPWNVRVDGAECHLIDPGGRDWVDSDARNIAGLIEWVEGTRAS